MKKHSEFVEFLNEIFEEFGLIEIRKMFGGYGIYRDGVMFGLVEKNTLYLKADEATQKHFESRGLPPFQYERAGKVVKLSYYRAPEEIYDDHEKAAVWARRSFEAALKQCNKKINKRKKTI
jgi:DNA transformation protein